LQIQNSCNTLYLRNIVCFRYRIVNSMHKDDNKDDDDDDDGSGSSSSNNNNNNLITFEYGMD